MNGKYEETPVGTPQGGNLSPLLSNIMLNELDKELESRGLQFVRYADDALIFVKSEKAANRVMKSIVRFIEEKLGLIVNVEKSKISRPKELKFLGFGYYYDSKNKRYQVKPHPISVQKFQRKLRQLTKRNWSVPLDYRILKLKQVIFGWVNYFRIANMKKAMKRIDMKLRSRIRVIIWKQWKVPKKQIKSLNSTRDSGGRSERINLLSKRLPIYRIIESCSKSNLKQKTKAEGTTLCFRTLSKSTHCNIN